MRAALAVAAAAACAASVATAALPPGMSADAAVAAHAAADRENILAATLSLPGCTDPALRWLDPECALWRGKAYGAVSHASVALPVGATLAVPLRSELRARSSGLAEAPPPRPALLVVTVLAGGTAADVAGSLRLVVLEQGAGRALVEAATPAKDGATVSAYAPAAPTATADGRSLLFPLPHGVVQNALLELTALRGKAPALTLRLTLDDADQLAPLLAAGFDDKPPPMATGAAAVDASSAAACGRRLQLAGPPGAPDALTDGVPVFGSVGPFQWSFYAINYTVPLARVDLTLESLFGDADAYVTLDGSVPTMVNYQYRAVGTGAVEAIAIAANDTQVAAKCPPVGGRAYCPITIGVRGFGSVTNYTLVAASSGVATALTSGVPLADQAVAAGAYRYYTLAGPDAGSAITITVSPQSGDPDVVVSSTKKGTARPRMDNTSTYCRASVTASREVIELWPGVPSDADCFCGGTPGCTYYIGVLGFGSAPASFSVLGTSTANPITTLLDGEPQFGYKDAKLSAQYVFNAELNVSSGVKQVEVLLTPYLGDGDLYVALDGAAATPSHWQYRSTHGGSQVEAVVVRSSDAVYQQYCGGTGTGAGTPCQINVGVFAFTATLYRVLASNAFYITLSDGLAQAASVSGGAFEYFRYTLTDRNAALVISVQQLGGDSDLFVGCDRNPNTTRPTTDPATWSWKSNGVGTELVTIYPGDARACAAPCNYYIGVTSYSRNASFSVMARARTTRPSALALGTSVTDVVSVGETSYWNFVWDWSASLAYVEVDAAYGDSDLYVTLDGSLPNRTNWAYASTSASGLEQVRISTGDPQFRASPCAGGAANATRPCVVTIAVYGFTSSRFTLSAWATLRELADGAPATASVDANEYDYFYYTAQDRRHPFSFFVTPLDAGDPDVYVSVLTPFPNASTWQWTSTSPGSEAIHIDPASDPRLANFTDADYPLTFYVGINAWGGSSATFTIVATSNPTVALADGVPVSGNARQYSLTYYSFYVPPPAPPSTSGRSFEVTAVPLSGGPVDLYVNDELSRPYPLCSGSCAMGVITNYHWSSDTSPARARVLVQNTDRYFATNRIYVIAVYAQANTTYSLVAGYTDSIRTLQSGVPVQDTVGRGAFLYYRLLLRQPGADVAVTVTPLSGDADLYTSIVSSNTRPGPSAFSKKSNGGPGQVEAVYFQWQELAECQANIPAGYDCDVYIGVTGYAGAPANATYTVTATVTTNVSLPVLLVDGEPQAGNVSAGRYAYYYALVSVALGTTYSVAVRSTSGDADVYVRTDGYVNPAWPTSTYNQYASTSSGGDDYVNVAPGTDGYNATALMRVAVYGFTAANYIVTYQTASAVSTLASGVALVGTLPRNGAAYYAFSVPTSGVDISFALTALSSDPDIYVSPWPDNQPRFRPGPGGTAACRSGTRYGSDTVEIYSTGGDPCYCSGCTYIVGVYCAIAASTCRYSITGSLVSPYSLISLAEGRPASNAVRQWGYKYFSYDASAFNSTARNVTLRLGGSAPGSVRMFASNTYVPGLSPVAALPSNASSTWASPLAGPSAGVLTIAYNDPAVTSCRAGGGAASINCTFFTIAVQGLAGGTALPFTITASSTDQPQLLVPGVPSAPAEVLSGGAAHFAVDVDDVTYDLVVAVTVLSGRVALSVDPALPGTGCKSVLGAVSCDGVWANTASAGARPGTAALVRIVATAPCSGAYVNPAGNCTIPAAVWRPGRYYIGVFGASAATFTVTALQASSLVHLEEAVPFTDATSNLAPVTGVYQPSFDSSAPSVKITLDASASDAPLSLYVVSCVEGILGPNACNSAARAPGPTNFEQFLSADSGTSADLVITKHSPAFCSSGSPSATCSYYVAVLPTGDCNPPACDGSFTVTASQDVPGGRTQITFASIDGRVAEYIGNIAAGPGGSASGAGANLYEVFLSSAPGLAVNVSIEACGGAALPSMYLCDPAPPAGVTACSNAFVPSRASYTSALHTAASPAGRAAASLVGLTSPALYAAVVADGAINAPEGGAGVGAGQAPPLAAQYVITASAGRSVTYLYPPPNASLTLVPSGDGGTTLNVSWAAPLIGGVGTPGAGVPAAGVSYAVYAAPVSFTAAAAAALNGAAPPLLVPTTSCGLAFWSQVAQLPPVVVTGQTWAELTDLAPNTVYQVNVAATCSNPCWAANGLRVGGAGAAMPATVALGGGAGLGAPGYNTQRVAYAGGFATTGAGGSPTTEGTPVAVIATAIAVTLVALGGGLFACVRYRRSKAVDLTYQYVDAGNVDGAMSTISTPAGNVGGAVARSASAAGGAILSGLRALLAVPAAAVAAGGYTRPPPMAGDGGEYSEMDDRVAGYM